MEDKKLESLAYRLADLDSLRSLFAHLNYNFADEPANKDAWTDDERNVIQEARVIAKKDDYKVYYLQTNTDSLKHWKGISAKIIKENHGLCLICSHNPSGFKWVFSSLSKEFSKSFNETRHIPIDIRPETGTPKTFVDFLEKIRVSTQDSTTTILAKMSDAFDSFAIQIHDELTVNVFEALKTLSEGIIYDQSNNLSLSDETLEDIRESIFILLYRIIFILYAEDRGIFPIEDKIYRDEFSLKWIKEEWLLKSADPKKLTEYQVQKRLKHLFRLIEVGSEELDYKKEDFFMRSYYGRIFDRKINHKLEEWNIPNSNLLEAISLVTRNRDKKGNYFFLDYSALETRHLGSIYEHLLEFHLHVKNKKIEELPNPNDRKTSGSYYTPQYVVDYIVKNSIEPRIKKIQDETDDKLEQVEKILSLNILDPAMGSGHFLIGAVNYMASRICEIENGEILEHNFIERKRDVARRCVYGVDLNSLAVDLATVSLWLETLSSDKPLSFLNAHLKNGNSLIGTRIDVLFNKQTTLMESQKGREQFKKNIKDFIMFENLEDDSASAVKIKIEKYQKIQSKGTIYYNIKSLLDCKVAESFGLDIPIISDFKAKIGENNLDFFSDDKWEKIKNISSDTKFFHWDLEFPDIFYDENGDKKSDGGFDIVVGNPPYFNVKKDDPLKKYDEYEIISDGIVNSASLFIDKSLKLLKKDAILGLIIPKSFLIVDSWQKIRNICLENSIQSICDVGSAFKDVGLEQVIIILFKNLSQNNYVKILVDFKELNYISQAYFKKKNAILTSMNKEQFQIIEKIEKDSILLGRISEMPRGITVRSSEFLQNSTNDTIQVLGGTNVAQYAIKNGSRRKPNRFLNKNNESIENKKHIFFKKRIIYQNVASSVPKIVATIDDGTLPTDDTLNNLILHDSEYSYEYVLGLLNSKLMTFYLRYAIINNSILTVHLDKPYLGKIPIKKTSTDNIIPLVKSLMLSDNKTSENEIKRIIEKINMEIYKIYKITDEERTLIESSII